MSCIFTCVACHPQNIVYILPIDPYFIPYIADEGKKGKISPS